MTDRSFAEIGKIEAITSLFEGTPYKAFEIPSFESKAHEHVITHTKALLEGIDFNLEYFPLPHLGYKAVIAVTGELYASLASTRTLSVVLGISAKLDYPQISELWKGIVSAASEHKYEKISLELEPSKNGLSICLSGTGSCERLTAVRRPLAKSKDLICVSGPLGASYLGMQALERRLPLEEYRMIVGSYIKPELSPDTVSQLKDEGIYPSLGYFVTKGLADAVKRMVRDSGLGAKIYADKIPFEGNSFQLGRELDIDPVSAAMNGGDDYRLLFSIPILHAEKFRRNFQTFDIIGHLALAEVGAVLVSPDGLEHNITAQGWGD